MKINDVLNQLKNEGFQINDTNKIKQKPKQIKNPLAIQILIGCSAWFSAVFLMISISISLRLYNNSGVYLGLGIFFLVFTTILFYVTIKSDNIFLNQILSAFFMVGEFGFCFGLFEIIKEPGLIIIVIIQIMIIILNKNSFVKFISTSIALFTLVAFFDEMNINSAIHLLVLFICVGLMLYAIYKPKLISIKKNNFVKPVFYAATLFVMSLFIIFVFQDFNDFRIKNWLLSTLFISINLGILFFHIIKKQKISYKYFILISLLLIALTIITKNSSGILIAFFIISISFYLGEKFLFSISNLFLAFYLFFYYYNLKETLLMKSIVLMISGLFMIVASIIMIKLNNRNKGVTS